MTLLMSSLRFWLTKFINLNGCIYHIWPSLVVVILQTEQKTVIRSGMVNKKGACSLLWSLYCVNQASQLSYSFCNIWWHAKHQKNLLSYKVAISGYLLSCKKNPSNVPSCQLNAKNNGLVLLLTLYLYWSIATLRSEKGNGRENVAEKVNSRSFNLHRDYSKSLTLSNVGEPS